MVDTWGDIAIRLLVGDAGVTVTLTVPEQPHGPQADPPAAAPPPAHHVPGTQPPAHHPHNPLAYTGLPAMQLLILAAMAVALGLLLVRAGRHSSEVGNA
jgi:hypothetical protein